MNKNIYGLLIGSGFGIIYSSAFTNYDINMRRIGLIVGIVVYTLGIIKTRDLKNKS